MVINSITNQKVVFLKKLQLKKYREEEKLFIIEGEHLVEEAYKKGLIKEIYILENKDYNYDATKIYVTEEVMKKISSLDKAPSIIGVCYTKEEKISGSKILMLDNIQDPGNLGTIIRSAVAFNVDTIILGEDTVDLYNPKVLRSTQGMNFHINIVTGDLIKIINDLKEQGFFIYGTSLKNKKALTEISVKDKYCLIMGNEGSGIKDAILDLCDENIYIKMNENCESLNVGVVTGIILYELSK